MKNVALFTLLLTTIVTLPKQSDEKAQTVGDIFFNWSYVPQIGEPMENSIDGSQFSNIFFGSLTGFVGLYMIKKGVAHLTTDLKQLFELWKKFEHNETITREWRKLPRRVIMSFIAFLASTCGLTVAYVGFNRFVYSRFHPDGTEIK